MVLLVDSTCSVFMFRTFSLHLSLSLSLCVCVTCRRCRMQSVPVAWLSPREKSCRTKCRAPHPRRKLVPNFVCYYTGDLFIHKCNAKNTLDVHVQHKYCTCQTVGFSTLLLALLNQLPPLPTTVTVFLPAPSTTAATLWRRRSVGLRTG